MQDGWHSMNLPRNPVFTIGYASLTIDRFIELLLQHHIDAVGDVRSQPYSRYTPEYSQDRLKTALDKAGIQYVFMGKELGARRGEPECYVDGKVRYDLVAKTPAFRDGITRIEGGHLKYRIALLCAEKDPVTCHRAILISRELSKKKIEVQHILHDGSLEPHEELEHRLLKLHGRDQEDLFEDETERLKGAYSQQADEIAFVREGED